MAKPNKDTLLDWYRQMVLIRDFEETCQVLYNEKRITGVYLHLYSGHEAVGVGALGALETSDHVITAYRDHGLALALGMDANVIMAEMMGRRDGVSGGKGGSMHLASREHNFWGGYAIVGGHLPLASGIALAQQYNDTGAVVISFIGDGATNNGYFHEALNLAGVWDLPIVWIIENNGYGMGTEIERAAGNVMLHERANSYGIKDFGRCDGQNILEVNNCVSKAVEHARNEGSALIEAITYRYRGHGVSDKQYNSRLSDELEKWKQERDPITILERHLLKEYKSVDDDTLQKIQDEQRGIVAASVEFAEDSPMPATYDELMANIYVE